MPGYKETAVDMSVKVTVATLTKRKGPGISYSKVGTLNKGTTVSLVAKSKDKNGTTWYKIKGSSQWVSGSSNGKSNFKVLESKTVVTNKNQATPVNMEVEVTSKTLTKRKGPGTSYSQVATLKKGAKLKLVAKQTDANGTTWYKIKGSSQWVAGTDKGNPTFKVIKNTPVDVSNVDSVTDEPIDGEDAQPSTDKFYDLSAEDLKKLMNAQVSTVTPDSVNNRLLGLPYQFLDTADMRIDKNNDMGRLFCYNIFAEAPIVTILPGSIKFLPDYKTSEKQIFQNLWEGMDNGDENAESALQNLIDDNGEARYFDFELDYGNYIKYVNLLCRITAVLLGIGDDTPPGIDTPYKKFDWGNYKYFNNYKLESGDSPNIFDKITDSISDTILTAVDDSIAGSHQYLSIYVDPSTSFNETPSNEVSKSALEGKFDEMQSKIKEYSFFAYSNALGNELNTIQGWITNIMDGISSIGSEGGFLNSLLGKGKQQIVNGSNLIFPEIWQDSTYDKSYTISTTFISPYGDKESIYLNCLVPMYHLLALALPKQTTANTYTSPFLVKMFSKGWFSCDMGIVESVQLDKGSDQSWSVDGLPTQVKVSLTVKDLYSRLMLSPSNSPSLFFSNQGMIDFMGSICGVDLSRPAIELKVKIAMSIFFNRVTDVPSNWYRSLVGSINNRVRSLLT